MALTKLIFKPGIHREGTSFSEEGSWYDCDKVRFRFGNPEIIGGWVKSTANLFFGVCRSALNWILLNGYDCLALGTNDKMYVEYAGTFNDITPIRYTDTNTNPITSGTAGSTTQTYTTSAAHGAGEGDFVTFSGLSDVDGICTSTYTDPFTVQAVGSGILFVNAVTAHYAAVGDTVTFSAASAVGGITAAQINTAQTVLEVISPTEYTVATAGSATSVATGGGTVTAVYLGRLNREFQVISVPSATTFTFVTDTPCTTGAVTGGGTATAEFQVSVGYATNIVGGGWSSGTWSRNTWSSALNQSISGISMRIWSMDHFGQDLVYCQREGPMFYWAASGGFPSRGVYLSSMSGAADVPASVAVIKITDDRHVLAIGATDRVTGVFDPLLIRWCNQEDPVMWTPAITNTAGSIRIPLGSFAMAAISARQETLIWTNRSLHSLQFIGPPYTFDLQTVAENITITSPNATISVNDIVYWMGINNFWAYSGRVQAMPCTVRRFVFEDINDQQYAQIYSSSNDEFSEVTWFYCSAASSNIDRYVTYNYQEDAWTIGSTTRTTMTFCGGRGNHPYGTDGGDSAIGGPASGELYVHEEGYDDGSTNPPSPMLAYIESSDFSVNAGDKLIFADRLIPDLTFARSTSDNPQVTLSIEAKKFSGDAVQTIDDRSIAKTATVDQYTNQVWVRLRGRQMRLKITSNTVGTAWLLGTVRLNIRIDGVQ